MDSYSEYFLDSAGNIKIAVRFYRPSEIPHKAILIIHGFGEHGGRFESIARYFVLHSFLAVTVDLRGNGRSEGNRGDAKKYSCLLEDIKVAHDKINELFPGIETVIYAHSFGCNITLSYCINNCKGISSLIMASPWIYDQNRGGVFFRAGVWIGAILFPKFSFNIGVKGVHLSDNMELIEQYRNDPLKHKRITLRLVYQANNAGRQAINELCNLQIPVLIMYGSNDTICSTSIIDSALKTKAIKNNEITIKTWDGAFHELHSWSNNKFVFDFTKDWIEKVIK